ncbi:hypothetical protein ACFZAU_20080 [Streptomyces sp. NPDC008238]
MGVRERERKVCRPLRRAGLEVIADAVPPHGSSGGSMRTGTNSPSPRGFAMMALDSSVFVRASTGETGVDVLAVRHPDRSANVRRHLASMARSPYVDRELRERLAAWLAGR